MQKTIRRRPVRLRAVGRSIARQFIPSLPETSSHTTRFEAAETGGLGPLTFHHPPGTFALTPASRIALQAIFRHHNRFGPIGIDWGCGSGCLGIAAARSAQVTNVICIDVDPANVAATRRNADENGVRRKIIASAGNSYQAFEPDGAAAMSAAAGFTDFIIANPPASTGDDGFGFRREVVSGAPAWLRESGVLFLNISSQYGRERIAGLGQSAPALRYEGVLETSPLVEFDLTRPDLLECLADYAATEVRGGAPYEFFARDGATPIHASQALAHFREDGISPLSRWQVHLFRRWR